MENYPKDNLSLDKFRKVYFSLKNIISHSNIL